MEIGYGAVHLERLYISSTLRMSPRRLPLGLRAAYCDTSIRSVGISIFDFFFPSQHSLIDSFSSVTTKDLPLSITVNSFFVLYFYAASVYKLGRDSLRCVDIYDIPNAPVHSIEEMAKNN